MAGGTICFTEKGFAVRLPELRSSTTLAVTRCEKHAKGVLCLGNAFSLIEGHPEFLLGLILRAIRPNYVDKWLLGGSGFGRPTVLR